MDEDMPWKEVVYLVLENSPTPMHTDEIAQAISDLGLRTSLGATPSRTVSRTITESLLNDDSGSPYEKFAGATYGLKNPKVPYLLATSPETDDAENTEMMGLINAFGMYWRRDQVDWDPTHPVLLGRQQPRSTPVDFSGQSGVYILYDGSRLNKVAVSGEHITACATEEGRPVSGHFDFGQANALNSLATDRLQPPSPSVLGRVILDHFQPNELWLDERCAIR